MISDSKYNSLCNTQTDAHRRTLHSRTHTDGRTPDGRTQPDTHRRTHTDGHTQTGTPPQTDTTQTDTHRRTYTGRDTHRRDTHGRTLLQLSRGWEVQGELTPFLRELFNHTA